MAKVKQHMGVAVNGPTPSLGVPSVAQPTLAPALPLAGKRHRSTQAAVQAVVPRLPAAVPPIADVVAPVAPGRRSRTPSKPLRIA